LVDAGKWRRSTTAALSERGYYKPKDRDASRESRFYNVQRLFVMSGKSGFVSEITF
jgi:hypothetical protein